MRALSVFLLVGCSDSDLQSRPLPEALPEVLPEVTDTADSEEPDSTEPPLPTEDLSLIHI